MPTRIKGRGANLNPPNRFERLHVEPLDDHWEDDRTVETEFLVDTSRSILAKNDSPDLEFTYSINPYRGCEHGCVYCYARPSHEYLGFSAGADFESRILVKPKAPELLEQAFNKKSWQPQVIAFSGNTDPYQPVERKLQLTRRCLEVFLKYRNPVEIVTKNFLVTRDLDILQQLASLNLVHVLISITSLDPGLVRVKEPRTPTPAKRLEAIEILADNKIPVGVNAAPIIPGLNDEELPSILEEASARGATSAGYILVKLPGEVKTIFLDWLHRELPERESKIVNRLREVRGGKLSDSRFGTRMRGEGKVAETIKNLFRLACKRYHLNGRIIKLSTEHFLRTPETSMSPKQQLEIF
jgi:DNA repair photolyase